MRTEVNQLEQVCVIVNEGMGSKVLKYALEKGGLNGAIMLCKGTVRSKLLEWLDLDEDRRELVFIMTLKGKAQELSFLLNEKFKLYKPNHGIVYYNRMYSPNHEVEIKGEQRPMYQAIYVIVDKGKANDVIRAGKEGGARGGTIFNARSAGIHEPEKLFSMAIEPEREMVMILAEIDKVERIVNSITINLDLNVPGNGILYVQPVEQVIGLFE